MMFYMYGTFIWNDKQINNVQNISDGALGF